MIFTILVVLVVLVVVFLVFRWWSNRGKYHKNIWMDFQKKSPKMSEEDIDKMMEKSLYESEDELKDKYDVIIIGSGISASVAAGLLSRAEKKVLLLEKHDRLGGYCHTFEEGIYKFCAGLHFMTRFEQPIVKNLAALLSDNTFEFIPVDCIERYTHGDVELEVKGRGFDEYCKALYEKFPEERDALQKYFAICEKCRDNIMRIIITNNVPFWMRIPLKIFGFDSNYHKYGKKTIGEVMDECGIKDEACRHVLSIMQILYNTHGDKHEYSNFSIQAVITLIYHQKFLPVGGGGRLVKCFLSNLKNGSVGICNCDVKRILVRKDNSTRGVELASGQKILCDTVISSAGFENSINFIPRKRRKQLCPELLSTVEKYGNYGGMYYFIACGVDASEEEVDLKNMGIHMWTCKKEWDNFEEHFSLKPPDFDGFEEKGCFYLSNLDSFDPHWKNQFPNKTKLVIFTILNYDWVKPYEGTRTKQRGRDYEELKENLTGKIMEQVYSRYPKLEDKIELLQSGTCLTAKEYDYWPFGTSYGTTPTYYKQREVIGNDKVINPFKGFYLVGQELIGPGVALTMLSSFFAVGRILGGRSMFKDAIAAEKAINGKKKKE